MIPHAGIIHASGWIIIKKIQVAITQEVSTIRNNLIFANNGLGAVVAQSETLGDCVKILIFAS